jgi:hypothetical protein
VSDKAFISSTACACKHLYVKVGDTGQPLGSAVLYAESSTNNIFTIFLFARVSVSKRNSWCQVIISGMQMSNANHVGNRGKKAGVFIRKSILFIKKL